MLRLDLSRLEREGAVVVRADIPPDDPIWQDSGLVFEGPLHVDLTAHEVAGSGEVVVRGRLHGLLQGECRRCLERVQTEVDEHVTLVYSEEEELTDDLGEVRPIPRKAHQLDLSDAIREEVILVQSPFFICNPDCRGLCPRCGANLNAETCGCAQGKVDSRWDALRTLENE